MMKRKMKIAAGVAGSVFLMSVGAAAAYTATGLARGPGVPETKFIGGQVSQSVSGATLSNIEYVGSDASNVSIAAIKLTFVEPLALSGAWVAVDTDDAGGVNWTCEQTGDANVFACSPDALASDISNVTVTVG